MISSIICTSLYLKKRQRTPAAGYPHDAPWTWLQTIHCMTIQMTSVGYAVLSLLAWNLIDDKYYSFEYVRYGLLCAIKFHCGKFPAHHKLPSLLACTTFYHSADIWKADNGDGVCGMEYFLIKLNNNVFDIGDEMTDEMITRITNLFVKSNSNSYWYHKN